MSDYDTMNRLTNEVQWTNSWEYDEAGNWLNASASSRWGYNADNELLGRTTLNQAAWTADVTGQVEPGPRSNKWYNTWAECRGVRAQVGQLDGAFTLPAVPLDAGTNALVVTVTDVSGNTSQQTRTVKKDVIEGLRYDGNGNLTNWFSGTTNWVYEWDWADRMTKVTSNGVVVLENYYDAGSHRVAKAEVVGSSVTRFVYLYDGWDIVGISLAGSGLYESYTRGVSLAGDIGGIVGIARHAFNQKYYVHNNHRGDITHVRMNALTLSTYRYTAFGQMIGTTAGVSRFKFSSKERDASTGMLYYGYRFYAPQWQRWVSGDRHGEAAFDILSSKALTFRSPSPGSYEFTGNNPVCGFDVSGLSWWRACGSLCEWISLITTTSSLGYAFSYRDRYLRDYYGELLEPGECIYVRSPTARLVGVAGCIDLSGAGTVYRKICKDESGKVTSSFVVLTGSNGA